MLGVWRLFKSENQLVFQFFRSQHIPAIPPFETSSDCFALALRLALNLRSFAAVNRPSSWDTATVKRPLPKTPRSSDHHPTGWQLPHPKPPSHQLKKSLMRQSRQKFERIIANVSLAIITNARWEQSSRNLKSSKAPKKRDRPRKNSAGSRILQLVLQQEAIFLGALLKLGKIFIFSKGLKQILAHRFYTSPWLPRQMQLAARREWSFWTLMGCFGGKFFWLWCGFSKSVFSFCFKGLGPLDLLWVLCLQWVGLMELNFASDEGWTVSTSKNLLLKASNNNCDPCGPKFGNQTLFFLCLPRVWYLNRSCLGLVSGPQCGHSRRRGAKLLKHCWAWLRRSESSLGALLGFGAGKQRSQLADAGVCERPRGFLGSSECFFSSWNGKWGQDLWTPGCSGRSTSFFH